MTRIRRHRFRAPLLACLLVAAATAGPAGGHEIWLHADDFQVETGGTLTVRQLLGAVLPRDLARPRGARELSVRHGLTTRFELVTETGVVDLLESVDSRVRLGGTPALAFQSKSDGSALIAMEHGFLTAEHSREDFFDYLDHERLPRERFEPAMGDRAIQSEAYMRVLKSLVRLGNGRAESDLHRHAIGTPLEILLLQDPYRLEPGDSLDVRVTFRGKPLPHQTVTAYRGELGAAPIHRTTDSEGRTRFTLDAPGVWLVRTLFLTECSPASPVDCTQSAWESYWAAFSFELD